MLFIFQVEQTMEKTLDLSAQKMDNTPDLSALSASSSVMSTSTESSSTLVSLMRTLYFLTLWTTRLTRRSNQERYPFFEHSNQEFFPYSAQPEKWITHLILAPCRPFPLLCICFRSDLFHLSKKNFF